MGCFSFLCKKSGKPALSTSFDGSPCHLFLLVDGEVVEEMSGNYDSYGRVFRTSEMKESFEWEMDWSDVCSLMFDSNPNSGIAMILDEYWDGVYPTTQSESDPEQGWGEPEEPHKPVQLPFHRVYRVDVNIDRSNESEIPFDKESTDGLIELIQKAQKLLDELGEKLKQ